MKPVASLILSTFLLVNPVKKTPDEERYEEYLKMMEEIRARCEKKGTGSILIEFVNGRREVFWCI